MGVVEAVIEALVLRGHTQIGLGSAVVNGRVEVGRSPGVGGRDVAEP